MLTGKLTLKATGKLKIFCLLHFSKPADNRPIYRLIVRKKVRTILELGVSEGQRALRMIEAAARFTPRNEIQYIGLDQFEGRSEADGPGLTLVNAHRLLKQSGAKIKLLPGLPAENLMRRANEFANIDLLIVPSQHQSERLWFYMPRLMHEKSLILLENHLPDGKISLQAMSRPEIERLAAKAVRWRAA